VNAPDLDETLAQIDRLSSAHNVISDGAFEQIRCLDALGPSAAPSLVALIERNTDLWFDVAVPLFWLVERAPAAAEGLFLRLLGRPAARSLAVRGLVRSGGVASAVGLLDRPSPAERLGAAVALAYAPEVRAEASLEEAPAKESCGEVALALRLALWRRDRRAPMTPAAWDLGGADTPAHPAWTRVAYLRGSLLREVSESFDAGDDAELDQALRRHGSSPASGTAWAWRSGAGLSDAASAGLAKLIALTVAYGGDEASVVLLLSCVRYRVDEATAAEIGRGPLSRLALPIWADDAWFDKAGPGFGTGKSKQVYPRLHALAEADRPIAAQWVRHALRRPGFHGYRHSLWINAGPLVRVEPASDRLEALPDHGFSAAGERPWDHAGAPLTLRLGSGGSLAIVDGDGKTKKSPPKPPAPATAAALKAATAALKQLERRAKATSSLTLAILEEAMIAARTWAPEAWQARFLGHPFYRHAGALLVFLAGEVPFIIDVRGRLIDVDGSELALREPVRVAHPIDLAAGARTTLRDRLPDQPFPQLDRSFRDLARAEVHPGPHDVSSLLDGFAARGYCRGRSDPFTYHARDIGPYCQIVVSHEALRWNQRTGSLAATGVSVRRDELTVPWEAVPPSLRSEIALDLEKLGLSTGIGR
jgi:hypothetical protein